MSETGVKGECFLALLSEAEKDPMESLTNTSS